MKIPQSDQPQKYVGLYVLDFGDHCAVGYTAEEVVCLLESEQFSDMKVYKIYRARPNGEMELCGVPRDRFQLESGMFFHCHNKSSGQRGFEALTHWSTRECTPCRSQLQLAQNSNGDYVIALIYPAEYEHEIGQWLEASGYIGDGAVDAGVSQVSRYYQNRPNVVRREQLWPAESLRCRDRETLLAAVGCEFQR